MTTTLEQIVIDTGGDPYGSGDKWRFCAKGFESSRGEVSFISENPHERWIVNLADYHATKARLQNKPSWDSHDWPAICQSAMGSWYGVKAVTREDLSGLRAGDDEKLSEGILFADDWRDTLEASPVELQYDPDDVAFKRGEPTVFVPSGPLEVNGFTKEQSAIKTLESKGYVWRGGEYWAPPLGEVPDYIKWQGTEDGLPPVGCECFISISGHQSSRGVITYMGKGVYCYRDVASGLEYSGATNSTEFRPLQSERERWIEDTCKKLDDEVAKYNVNIECSAAIRATIEAIYDAGLGRLPQCKN